MLLFSGLVTGLTLVDDLPASASLPWVGLLGITAGLMAWNRPTGVTLTETTLRAFGLTEDRAWAISEIEAIDRRRHKRNVVYELTLETGRIDRLYNGRVPDSKAFLSALRDLGLSVTDHGSNV